MVLFIQVIQGTTNDAEGLRRQFERWQEDVRPNATGYLGTTAGVTDDGKVFVLARFESAEAAQSNSGKPEQDAWWNETAKYFEGTPSFKDYTDVDVSRGGGSDDAGFVQVMQGRVRDAARVREMEAEFMPKMEAMRPDVIGSIRGWDGNEYTEAIYFTSEADARQGEARMTETGGSEPGFEEYMSLIESVDYLDLKDPWLR
jgi:heme-degrading monooxygenase HmoA